MSDGSIDLGWLRLFLEISRRGSLSGAAKALGLTQPAVSYQVRLLEQGFGVPLLKRLHRGVSLTDEGRRLLAIAERTVQEVDALHRDVRQARRRPVIRLATDYAFSSLWLIPRMASFRSVHPEIDLQIIASQRLATNWREEADLAVAFGARSDFPTATLLMPERVVPVCAPSLRDHLADGGTRVTSAVPHIHLEAEVGSPWLDWSSYLAAVDPRPTDDPTPGDLRFNTYSMVVQAAMGGQGLALGWLGLIDQLLQTGLLIVAGREVDVVDRGYWLIGASEQTGVVTQLAAWLQDAAATPFSSAEE
jgi:putative choline sulfate-utilization transcription factor